MATYNKPLKSIAITTLGGNTFEVADTASAAVASHALAEFEAGRTMHIKGSGSTALIPFHAVDNIIVTITTGEVTKGDPYGCETESDDSNDNEGEGG